MEMELTSLNSICYRYLPNISWVNVFFCSSTELPYFSTDFHFPFSPAFSTRFFLRAVIDDEHCRRSQFLFFTRTYHFDVSPSPSTGNSTTVRSPFRYPSHARPAQCIHSFMLYLSFGCCPFDVCECVAIVTELTSSAKLTRSGSQTHYIP